MTVHRLPAAPFPRPVETALDRLAARLGDAPLSPDVAAGLEAGPEHPNHEINKGAK